MTGRSAHPSDQFKVSMQNPKEYLRLAWSKLLSGVPSFRMVVFKRGAINHQNICPLRIVQRNDATFDNSEKQECCKTNPVNVENLHITMYGFLCKFGVLRSVIRFIYMLLLEKIRRNTYERLSKQKYLCFYKCWLLLKRRKCGILLKSF